MDHYESSVSGRLPFTKGLEPSHTQYRGGELSLLTMPRVLCFLDIK
jgi:hypothetical protein